MRSFYFDNGVKAIIPYSWLDEKNDNLVSFYDPVDGVGALQFSFYKAIDADFADLGMVLYGYLRDKHDRVDIKQFPEYAACSILDEDGVYWRYWLFLKRGDLIFVSYNCGEAAKNGDYDIVNNIIKSITLV